MKRIATLLLSGLFCLCLIGCTGKPPAGGGADASDAQSARAEQKKGDSIAGDEETVEAIDMLLGEIDDLEKVLDEIEDSASSDVTSLMNEQSEQEGEE